MATPTNFQLDFIILSLLVQDFYKFSMGNVIFKYFGRFRTKWVWKCRNKNVRFDERMVAEIRRQIDHFCTLRFTDEEIDWLGSTAKWLSPNYLDRLRDWSPKRNEIKINEGGVVPQSDCGLAIEAEGSWFNTSMYEIPILAIVNEVYFAFTGNRIEDEELIKNRTVEKFGKIKDGTYDIGTFSEFGLRRRYSSAMQDWIVRYIVTENIPGFVGTSNVYLAKKYGVKPIGTLAHEMAMALMGDIRWNVAFINERVMDVWTKEYEIKNGIYLTDAVGREAFLADFGEKYATLFSGVRHDSGDPFEWGDAMLAHYRKLGIDPMTKTLLFSDSLNFEKATNIRKYFKDKCKVAFGIGTYITNPLDNPLNIVMKVAESNGHPVCKLTDDIGKASGTNAEFIEYVKRSIDWRLNNVK